MWKWFQVLGGHNLDSLCLMDYSFINTALGNKIKILERIGKLPGDTHIVFCDGHESCFQPSPLKIGNFLLLAQFVHLSVLQGRH